MATCWQVGCTWALLSLEEQCFILNVVDTHLGDKLVLLHALEFFQGHHLWTYQILGHHHAIPASTTSGWESFEQMNAMWAFFVGFPTCTCSPVSKSSWLDDTVEHRCRFTPSYVLLEQGSPGVLYAMDMYPLCGIISPLARIDGSRNPGMET